MLELSSVSIVLNEGPYIGEWIDYHKDRFGEMVIVDGGSTDDTVEIIKSKGIEPFYRKWERNYSLQRNFSIDNAKFDWVFVLDVDHRVSDELSSCFCKLIQVDNCNCYEVPFIHFVDGVEIGRNSYMNFFRKSSGIRYWREVHEGICDKQGYPVREWVTLPSSCCVYHLKTLAQVEKSLKNYVSYGEELGYFSEESANAELKRIRGLLGYE